MEHVVIVSQSDRNTDIIITILKKLPCREISFAKTLGEARMMSFDYDIDLYIIFSPVDNKSGEDLAKELTSNGVSQVIMIVNNDNYDYLASSVSRYGVLVVPSPVQKEIFWVTLKLASATIARLQGFQKINNKLTQKIEDIRIIDRAKCLLISHLSMNEKDAHKYIEKKAMDIRTSKRMVAETILKNYET